MQACFWDVLRWLIHEGRRARRQGPLSPSQKRGRETDRPSVSRVPVSICTVVARWKAPDGKLRGNESRRLPSFQALAVLFVPRVTQLCGLPTGRKQQRYIHVRWFVVWVKGGVVGGGGGDLSVWQHFNIQVVSSRKPMDSSKRYHRRVMIIGVGCM